MTAPASPPTLASRSYTPPPGFIKGGMPAPFPDDEDERVAALLSYRILDTAAEESFDHLAFLASQICQTPIALVSFVDTDRQWFKAKVGLQASETSRDHAFCGYSILDVGNVFVVPDASTDIRFADNPLVKGNPHIRFYAGAPIVSSDGHAFGSICAIDDKPRQLSPEQLRSLQMLAEQAMTQLELKQRVTRLTDTLQQLQETKRQLRQSKEHAEQTQRLAERAREQAERAKAEAERQRGLAEEAKREAVQASSAKSSFLANMSHEIRTPMNGVLGYASMLADSALSEEQLDMVNTITVSGEHLLTLLNDVLDFSKAEASKLELEHAPVNVQAAVEQALQLTHRADTHSELDVYYSVAADVPAVVYGDVTRLRQILANLISNALKFTGTVSTLAQHCTPRTAAKDAARRKEVVVSVTRREGSAEAGAGVVLQFSVRDTGIGIAADKLCQLFSAFTQVHTNKLYGGTGLGLVISQRLARQMGGEMWAESEEGQGSVFSFTVHTTVCEGGERREEVLDALKPSQAAPASNGSGQQLPCTMLMVCDNEGMLASFVGQLQRWGVKLLTATSTQAAVSALKTSAARGERVTATLVHHHGGVDVLDTAQRIREVEASLVSPSAAVPIIACLPPFTPPTFDSALCNRLCTATVRCPIILTTLRNTLDTVVCALRAELATNSRPPSATATPSGMATSRRLFQPAAATSPSPPASPRNGLSPLNVSRPLVVKANTTPAVQRAERTVRAPAVHKQLASQYPLDILIVEDNPVNMKLLRKMLANLGYDECQQAGDGMQAVRLVEEERQHFNVIFMDCIMPVMGGVDCTKRLLQFYRSLGAEGLEEPVIVAMTASAMEEDKRECMAAGMREFVSKPVNAARLQDVITAWGKEILAKRTAAHQPTTSDGGRVH